MSRHFISDTDTDKHRCFRKQYRQLGKGLRQHRRNHYIQKEVPWERWKPRKHRVSTITKTIADGQERWAKSSQVPNV